MSKIKFYIITLLLLLQGQECFSQTFNKSYIIGTDSFAGVVFTDVSVDSLNSIVCSFAYIDEVLPNDGSGLVKMDGTGTLLSHAKLALPRRRYVWASSCFDEANHYLVSTFADTSVFSFSVFDSNLSPVFNQFINYQNYGTQFNSTFVHKIDANRFGIGGILRTANFANKNSAIIFIVDSTGVINKTIVYNTSKWSDSFSDIHFDDVNNRIWVSGTTFDEYTQDKRTYGVSFVIEYDTNWNRLSRHSFPDSLQIFGLFNFQFTDTSYYLATGFGVKSYPGLNDMQKPRLLESDLNGNVIWNFNDTTGVYYPNSVFVDVKTDDKGAVYGLAYSFTETDLDSIYAPPGVYGWKVMHQASLYKWNSNKELQWVRHIRHKNARSYNTVSYPASLAVLPDYTIVIAGYYVPGQFDTGLYRAQGWLVKTDSNGCVSGSSCKDWKITGINEIPEKLKGVPFVVYPNPSTSGVIYSKTKFSLNNKTSIYSLSGELVCKTSFINSQVTICSELSNGYYILKVYDNNQFYVAIINVDK